MTEIRVSVIVPIYNVAQYIERCAESLFNQTLREGIEFIFVDDCSPDSSVEIVENLLSRYPYRESQTRIIRHDKNRGSAAARATGHEVASGRYIIHCDSDDWVERDMYEKMLSIAEDNHADIVVCDYFGEYGKGSIRYRQSFDSSCFTENILSGKLHNSMCNKLINRDLYNYFDFVWTEGVDLWEDVSVVTRLAYYAKNVVYLDDSLYHYNQINNSSYTKAWSDKYFKSLNRVSEIVIGFYSSKNDKRYDIPLNWFKLRVKFAMLSHARGPERGSFMRIFPEADTNLMSHPSFPKYSKLAMWLWLKVGFWSGDLLLFLVNAIKKLR